MFSEITCDKPSFTQGTVAPDDATVAFEGTYTVTCNSGWELTGTSATMTCTSTGGFDQTPSCTGIHFIVLIVRILLANFTIVGQIVMCNVRINY